MMRKKHQYLLPILRNAYLHVTLLWLTRETQFHDELPDIDVYMYDAAIYSHGIWCAGGQPNSTRRYIKKKALYNAI
jgi:hypothetical protein